MTIEQKAKKYDEALEWMRELYPGLHGATKEDAEHYFPELKESQDEIHRKWILEYLYEGLQKSNKQFKGQFKSAIDWLEKQKEHLKSKDSISSDCVTNAKCEDRSPKHNISVDEIAQDYIDGVKEYNPEPTWDLMQTAVCYGYNYREQKEQPKVDLEEEIKNALDNLTTKDLRGWFRYFYELGLKVGKED